MLERSSSDRFLEKLLVSFIQDESQSELCTYNKLGLGELEQPPGFAFVSAT